MLELRGQAAEFAGVAPDSLQQVLINEYAADAGLGWHRDKPMFRDVIAVSLSGPGILRFRRKQGKDWERAYQNVAPRSIYLMRGASRWEWEHSISEVNALRYSVTFRNFVSD